MTDSKKVTLNVKIDAELKQRAEEAFKAMGANTTVAVTMFFKEVTATGKMPFVPKVYSESQQGSNEK